MSTKSNLSLLITCALLASASPANASGYTFIDLGTAGGSTSYGYGINNAGQVVGAALSTSDGYLAEAILWNGTTATHLGALGGSSSWATAINNVGDVAGWAFDSFGYSYATVWNGTAVANLGTLGGFYSAINAINDTGQTAGYAAVPGGFWHAALWNGTTAISDLGAVGGPSSQAYAINNSGQVAGYSNLASGAFHATLWTSTTATDLGTLGGIHSEALAINDSGQAVGYADTLAGGRHAAMWDGIKVTDLGTLGADYSIARGINDSGQVVGQAFTIAHVLHATLWNGTTITDLNSFLDASTVSAGWVLQDARGINDKGDIVGDAVNSRSGETHAFLLTAEPGLSPANPILPIVNLPSGWQFEFTIPQYPDPFQFVFFDPLVATGYDYILDSGPSFTSVLLPSIGDNQFGLYLWNGSAWTFDSMLGAGIHHSFGSVGVDRFRIVGIETSAGLDPNSPTAFVTGLTFAGTGEASMRMIPLTQEVGVVPEPGTYAMLLAGLGLMSFVINRRSRGRLVFIANKRRLEIG